MCQTPWLLHSRAPVTPSLLKCLDLSASNRGSPHSQSGAMLLKEEEAEALGRGIAALNCGSAAGILSSQRGPPSQHLPRSLEAGEAGSARSTFTCLPPPHTCSSRSPVSQQPARSGHWDGQEGVARVRAKPQFIPLSCFSLTQKGGFCLHLLQADLASGCLSKSTGLQVPSSMKSPRTARPLELGSSVVNRDQEHRH